MKKMRRFDGLIIGGFTFLLLLVLAIATIGATTLNRTTILFQSTYEHHFQAWLQTALMDADVIAVHRAMKDVALAKNGPQVKAALEQVTLYDQNVRGHLTALQKEDPDNPLLASVIENYDNWAPIRAQTIAYAEAGFNEKAALNSQTVGAAQVRLIQEKLNRFMDQKRDNALGALNGAIGDSRRALLFLVYMTLAAALLAIVISLVVRSRLLAMQRALFDGREKLQVTFNSIGDGIITTDVTGAVLSLNHVAEAFTGWTSTEATGKPFRQVFHIINEHTGDPAKSPVEEVLTCDRICLLENHTILIARDGTRRHIADSAAPIKDEAGKTTGVVMVFRDVTESKQAEEALQHSTIMLEATLQSTADGIEALDLDGNLMFLNEQFRLMWLVPDHINDSSRILEHCAQLLHNPTTQIHTIKEYIAHITRTPNIEISLIDGRTLERFSRPIELGGKTTGYVLSFRDITERKRATAALVASEERLKSMIANISDSIAVIDKNVKLRYLSPNLEAHFGWRPEDLLKMDLTALVHPEDLPSLTAGFKRLIDTDGAMDTFVFRLRHADSTYMDICLTAVNMFNDPTIQGLLMNFRDISDHIQHENDILYLSYHDVLTGLYNRAFFEEECARLDTERQLPISLIMGDINGLKLVNDAFGHKEGDKLLTEMAKILADNCRREDILARTGGDEFCILLPQTSSEDAQALCRRIYSDCQAYEAKEEKDAFYLSISLGHATKTETAVAIEAVLAEAEENMYRQKLLERKSMRSSLLSSIKTTMIEKNHLTEEHEERLVALSVRLGQALSLSDTQLSALALLSTLHDIGKLSVDENILNKPGPLTEEEWTEIRKHPEVGYRIANASPELAPIADFILCHHERWDGTGYPQSLSGEAIPLLSRIVAIVDAYDAMTQDRPYRQALPPEAAAQEIADNAGTQFDPTLAALFQQILDQQTALESP